MQDIYDRARAIRLAIFDVDGVMTGRPLYYSERGEELKVFDVRDGHGLKMRGFGSPAGSAHQPLVAPVAFAPKSRISLAIRRRGQAPAFGELLRELRLDDAAASFMGDDLIDFAGAAPVRPCAHRGRRRRGSARCRALCGARRRRSRRRARSVRAHPARAGEFDAQLADRVS